MAGNEPSFEAHGAAEALEPVSLTEQDVQVAEEFRRQQQLAVLVVMFSDIEKSTDLLESKGEVAYAKLRRQHDDIVRTVVEKEDSGRCVKHLGDGFMALFAEPSTAVERCIELQQRIPRECGIRIRIGLDMGQIAVEKAGGTTRDAFGRFVNRAARINAAAAGGQIFASYNVWDSAIGWLSPEAIAWRDLGELRVKGFANTVRCYEFYSVTSAYDRPAPEPSQPGASQPPLLSTTPVPVPQAEARQAVEKAVRDARTLLLSRQYPAALRSLHAASPLLPAAPVELQQQYAALKADAEKGASRLPKEQDLKGTIVAGSLDMGKARVAGSAEAPAAGVEHGAAAPRRAPAAPPAKKGFSLDQTRRRLRAWLRRTPAAKKVLWFDETPEKRAFIQREMSQRGAELDLLSDTMGAFKKLSRKKHELVVLVADNPTEGILCVQFVKLIRGEGFNIPVVLFSNVRTAYQLGAEAAKLQDVRCTSSLSELMALVGG